MIVRTTIRLDDAILKAAKKAALERDISLTRLIEEALQEKLTGGRSRPDGVPIRLVTSSGNGLQPGVDLDDSAALLDAMEK